MCLSPATAAQLVADHLQSSLQYIINRKIEFLILKSGELQAGRPEFDSQQWKGFSCPDYSYLYVPFTCRKITR